MNRPRPLAAVHRCRRTPAAATARFGPGARCRCASARKAGRRTSGTRRRPSFLRVHGKRSALVGLDDVFLSPGRTTPRATTAALRWRCRRRGGPDVLHSLGRTSKAVRFSDAKGPANRGRALNTLASTSDRRILAATLPIRPPRSRVSAVVMLARHPPRSGRILAEQASISLALLSESRTYG